MYIYIYIYIYEWIWFKASCLLPMVSLVTPKRVQCLSIGNASPLSRVARALVSVVDARSSPSHRRSTPHQSKRWPRKAPSRVSLSDGPSAIARKSFIQSSDCQEIAPSKIGPNLGMLPAEGRDLSGQPHAIV